MVFFLVVFFEIHLYVKIIPFFFVDSCVFCRRQNFVSILFNILKSDISFNGDISCNNIVFSGVIKNAAGEEVGLTLDVALIKDNAIDTSFEKISWLRVDKDSHFDLSDGGGIDASYLDIKFIHQPEISYNVIQEHTPGSKITFTSDVSMNESLRVSDLSLNTVRALNGNTITFLNDVSINKLIVNDLSNEAFYDLSNVVMQNITDISDVSGLVFDLSNVVSKNITDISDVSGLVFLSLIHI